MRQILFKAKRKDNNEWVYGTGISKIVINTYETNRYNIVNNCDYDELDGFIETLYDTYEVIPETIGQYTGLEDKNGTKIFEGDIVQLGDIKMEIFWGEDIGIGYGFCWKPYGEEQNYHESMTGFIDEYEVVGNIHDRKV